MPASPSVTNTYVIRLPCPDHLATAALERPSDDSPILRQFQTDNVDGPEGSQTSQHPAFLIGHEHGGRFNVQGTDNPADGKLERGFEIQAQGQRLTEFGNQRQRIRTRGTRQLARARTHGRIHPPATLLRR